MLCIALSLQSGVAVAQTQPAEPFEQDFILTAYYSPLPDQCCYVKGGYVADKILNGEGIRGADGTPVYPGMLAAPPSYAFGTRVVLPGLGTMTVHDRGGAIQEVTGAHRLDVWAGFGEEGLARALTFGVQRIRGKVYPPGTTQPHEAFALSTMKVELKRLSPFVVSEGGLADLTAQKGEQSYSVLLIQQALVQSANAKLPITGLFGPTTEQAIADFQKSFDLPANGEATEQTLAYLQAQLSIPTDRYPVDQVQDNAATAKVKEAQRLLRSLGYYDGRTDGLRSTKFVESVMAYQKDRSLITDAMSPGAGRIGPLTRNQLTKDWRKQQVALRAERILTRKHVGEVLARRGQLIDSFLSQGYSGLAVKSLQQMLVSQGFFPADKLNGVFGPLTAQAVTDYQLKHGLITDTDDTGAGTIGPRTLQQLRKDAISRGVTVVRARGWNAL